MKCNEMKRNKKVITEMKTCVTKIIIIIRIECSIFFIFYTFEYDDLVWCIGPRSVFSTGL